MIYDLNNLLRASKVLLSCNSPNQKLNIISRTIINEGQAIHSQFFDELKELVKLLGLVVTVGLLVGPKKLALAPGVFIRAAN